MTISRFVSCGEALIDLLPTGHETDDHFSSTWSATSAGGPMTTAIALELMGERAGFLGRLSTDALGRQLRGYLEGKNVDLELAVSTDEPTSMAVVSLDDDGRASYTFHFTDTANFAWRGEELPELSPTDWLHTGTLAVVIEPGASVLLDWAARQNCNLSVDLNVRPSLVEDAADYWARLEPWLEVLGERRRRGFVSVVKASDDDVNFLAGAVAPDRNAEDVFTEWIDRYGIDLGLLTLGPDGAVAVRAGSEPVRAPGHRVELVDTISAGDTFMAGFLAAYHRHPEDVAEALAVATAASALVVTRIGAQPPTRAEVEEFRRSR
ncbi:PfkB family carbohydrate kinase [Naumannella halotolerans]|uniref:PfkB family carbohydrate kinase n=1 Tax=Naumannella halotolerans TaxID=993414 RepID=UPI00370D445B